MAKRMRHTKQSSRVFKRRKFNRRRSTFKSNATTSTRASGGFFIHKQRKFNPRKNRFRLLGASKYLNHWRSIAVGRGTRTTNISSGVCTIDRHFLLKPDGVNNFWTTAGGCQQLDIGSVVPLFKGDITLRGATAELSFTSVSNYDTIAGNFQVPVRIKCWYIWTTNNPDFTQIPATSNIGWDPTASPDFHLKVGKIYGYKEFTLPIAGCVNLKYNIRAHQIDESSFNLSSKVPMVIYSYELTADGPPVEIIMVRGSCNLSFSADTVGTT